MKDKVKIRSTGEQSFLELIQVFYETLKALEQDHGIRHSRGATLYINPTDGNGKDVIPRKKTGEEVQEVQTRGPYRSAADDFKL